MDWIQFTEVSLPEIPCKFVELRAVLQEADNPEVTYTVWAGSMPLIHLVLTIMKCLQKRERVDEV